MINRALRLLRTYYRFSQVNLAKELGISNSYLSEIESGSKKPNYELLEKYASVFKMPISSILLFSETVNSGTKSSDKLRISAADKVLRLLEWIEDSDAINKQA